MTLSVKGTDGTDPWSEVQKVSDEGSTDLFLGAPYWAGNETGGTFHEKIVFPGEPDITCSCSAS